MKQNLPQVADNDFSRLKQLINQLPDSLDPAFKACANIIQAGRGDMVMELLSNTKNSSASVLKSRLFSAMGQIDNAISLLQETRLAAPTSALVLKDLTHLLKKQNRLSEAHSCALDLTKSAGDIDNHWHLLASCAQKMGEIELAIEHVLTGYQRCPKSHMLSYAAAQLYRQSGNFPKAVTYYNESLALGHKSEQAYQNLADCHYQTGRLDQAIAVLEQGLIPFPLSQLLHKLVLNIQYECKQGQSATRQVRKALQLSPDQLPLHKLLVRALRRMKLFDQALQQISDALKHQAQPDDELIFLKTTTEAEVEFDERIIRTLDRLVKSHPNNMEILAEYGRLLVENKRLDHAEQILQHALKVNPLDQLCLAYLSTTWRLQGKQHQYTYLCDAEKMVSTTSIRRDTIDNDSEFFRCLTDEIRKIHSTSSHPLDQSVRGGTQSAGHLFQLDSPILKELESRIKQHVFKLAQNFPADKQHPYWGRAQSIKSVDDLIITGAWSVILSSEGHHSNHVHPEGWMSSALYIDIPQEVCSGGAEGNIQFGEPLGVELAPQRTIKPQSGLMVTFPSYFWHGTIPFKSNSERITIAFDIIPRN